MQLHPTDEAPLEDPSRYWHIVGSLVYLTVTQPDIAHAVHNQTPIHFGNLLRTLQYLWRHQLKVYSMLVIVRLSFMLTQTLL